MKIRDEYCKEVNFDLRLVQVKAFEAENYLQFWKKSKAAKVTRIKWAAQEETGNEVWEEKGFKSYVAFKPQ